MTKLPEPNFIDRNPDEITNAWIKLYEEKSGKTLLVFCSTPSSRSLCFAIRKTAAHFFGVTSGSLPSVDSALHKKLSSLHRLSS